MKYIVDIDVFDTLFKVDSIGVFGIGKSVVDSEEDHSWSRIKSIEEFEELNSDYINEHFGDLQDTAYQRGLDDAWEAARRIIHMPEGDLLNIFTECYSAVCTALQVLLKYEAAEAIEKLKAYEEKQKTDNCIEIGDEVKWDGNKCIVTNRHIDINMGIIQDYDLMSCEGSVVAHVKRCSFVKTGRHFDIQSILEEMRHD